MMGGGGERVGGTKMGGREGEEFSLQKQEMGLGVCRPFIRRTGEYKGTLNEENGEVEVQHRTK